MALVALAGRLRVAMKNLEVELMLFDASCDAEYLPYLMMHMNATASGVSCRPQCLWLRGRRPNCFSLAAGCVTLAVVSRARQLGASLKNVLRIFASAVRNPSAVTGAHLGSVVLRRRAEGGAGGASVS